MPAGQQCDGPGCRTFALPHAPRWLILFRQPDAVQGFEALFAAAHAEPPSAFCSPLCLAAYAYVLAMTTGPATGAEPPVSGTGWPA